MTERPACTREKQRLEAVRLKEEGKTQQEIAEILGISQATVSRDLKTVTKRFMQQSKRELAKQIKREVYVADYVEKEAQNEWEAAERGKKDSNMLKRMLESSDRRAKLLGLVTERHDVTSDGQPVNPISLVEVAIDPDLVEDHDDTNEDD